jgi:hypothetical protein
VLFLENCFYSQKDVPGSHGGSCASSSHGVNQAVNVKVEEFSDVEDGEDPVPMSFMEIKFEREVSYMSVCLLLGTSQSHPELHIPVLISSVAKKEISRTQWSIAMKTYPVLCNDRV